MKKPNKLVESLGIGMLTVLTSMPFSGCSDNNITETKNQSGKLEYVISKTDILFPSDSIVEDIPKENIHEFNIKKGKRFSRCLILKNPSKDSPIWVYLCYKEADLGFRSNIDGFMIPADRDKTVHLQTDRFYLPGTETQKLGVYWKEVKKTFDSRDFKKDLNRYNYQPLLFHFNVSEYY